MESSLFQTAVWVLLGVYAVLTLWLVYRGANQTKNLNDYAIGSVMFSPYAVGLSLAASMTSAATFVINPGFIANYGWSAVLSFGVFLPIAAISSLILMTKSFRKHGQAIKALTLAQWVGNRYNSPSFALMMAFMALLLITFIVLIVVALTKVIAGALQIDEIAVMITLVCFVFGYMMFGGANSMVYTNMIQALIMIIVAVILLSSGYPFLKDGITSFWSQLTAIQPELTRAPNPGSPLFRNYYEIIFAQILVGVAIVVQPHIITKSLLLKQEQDVKKFLITAVIIQLLFFAVVFVGFYARLSFPDLMFEGKQLGNDGIIPAYVIHTFAESKVGLYVGVFVILGLIGAGMSTLEGLIQSVSTSITADIIHPLFLKGRALTTNLIVVNKIAIVGLAIITILLAREQLLAPKLSVGIFAQNGVYAYFSAAFIPVILGIFGKQVPLYIPFTAAIIAIVVHFGVYYGFPWLYQTAGVNFGAFNVFIEGKIQNPAIASSSAILCSSIATAFMLLLKSNLKKS
jgi:sodium/pantothenate symporter